jgi:hypothetical protein
LLWICVWVVAIVSLLARGEPVYAHGGGAPRLVNAPTGPYFVSVWTQPDPVRAGHLHVTAAVSDPATGVPVLAAWVEVAAVFFGEGEPVFHPATRGSAPNKFYHEADLELLTDGEVEVLIHVSGPAGTGANRFTLQILPSASGFAALQVIAAGLLVPFLAWSIVHRMVRKQALDPVAIPEASSPPR